jgi:transcriptional regulator NrdR family protein
MVCPECDCEKTIVKDSRPVEDNVFRRRVCSECGHKFFTEEVVIRDEKLLKNYHKSVVERRMQRELGLN